MDPALFKNSVIQTVLQTLFPELCLHCGARVPHRDFLCSPCAAGGILKQGRLISAPNEISRQYSFIYEGAAKTLFAAAKFSERRRAVNFFIREAMKDLQALADGSAVMIALPSRKKFLRRLLNATVPRSKLAFGAFQVKRRAFGKDANKLLGEAERYKRIHENLVWASAALPQVERYILCDDVSTTGATLNHAAYLLEKNLGVRKEQITLWSLMFRERIYTPEA